VDLELLRNFKVIDFCQVVYDSQSFLMKSNRTTYLEYCLAHVALLQKVFFESPTCVTGADGILHIEILSDGKDDIIWKFLEASKASIQHSDSYQCVEILMAILCAGLVR